MYLILSQHSFETGVIIPFATKETEKQSLSNLVKGHPQVENSKWFISKLMLLDFKTHIK